MPKPLHGCKNRGSSASQVKALVGFPTCAVYVNFVQLWNHPTTVRKMCQISIIWN